MESKQILLSFDVEEFDVPMEHGKELSLEEQFRCSTEGLLKILDLLDKYNARATFFTTANYAIHHPEIMKNMVKKGHEVASHGYYHKICEDGDLERSKKVLEEITEESIVGYRMAQMMPIDKAIISKAGYSYDSSIHPTFIPGRYNNLKEPRTFFQTGGLLEVPASVSPMLRFPLFWLSWHNLPFWLMKHFANRTIEKDNYLNIYFHPWEFIDLRDDEKFGMPFIIKNKSGEKLLTNLEKLIKWGQTKGDFVTFKEFIKDKI